MLSALKKRFNSNFSGGETAGSGAVGSKANASQNDTQCRRIGEIRMPAGVQPVNAELQKKFAQGVNFNMKIIIRGDRYTGKTSLWHRIQGAPFADELEETAEIQVASITWNYRTQNHVLKLDVWDVVDEGRRKRPADGGRDGKSLSVGLKLVNCDRPTSAASAASSNNSGGGKAEPFEPPACDATIVDVYKGCNCVLLIFDVTKLWTWAYVQRELLGIPSNISVLVLANKVDRPRREHQIGRDECVEFLSMVHRPPMARGHCAAPIRFALCSMKNAHGMRHIYNFFNIPFLFMQREYLEEALEANLRELKVTQDELDLYESRLANSQVDSYFERRQVEESGFERADMKSPLRVTAAGTAAAASGYSTEKRHSGEDSVAMTSKRHLVTALDRQLHSSSSSESGRGNRMVDMYEEDFDSKEDVTKQQMTTTSAETRRRLPIDEKSELPSVNGPADSSMFDSWLSKVESAKRPDELSSAFGDLGLSAMGVNANDAPPKAAGFTTTTTGPLLRSASESDDDNKVEVARAGGRHHYHRNPLVRRFSDEDEDEYSSGRQLSDEALSETAPSSLAYTVEEEKSSTSCSAIGFAHVSKPTKKSKKELSALSGSSTMTSVASQQPGLDSKDITNSSAVVQPAAKKSAKKAKSKTSAEGARGNKKSKKKTSKPADNLLVEDSAPGGDEPSGLAVDTYQYDPL